MTTMGDLHEPAKPACIILIGLHAVAALYHTSGPLDRLASRPG